MEVTGGEEALKEALYTKGPMTVSVDDSPEAFRFYKSGVFAEPKYGLHPPLCALRYSSRVVRVCFAHVPAPPSCCSVHIRHYSTLQSGHAMLSRSLHGMEAIRGGRRWLCVELWHPAGACAQVQDEAG